MVEQKHTGGAGTGGLNKPSPAVPPPQHSSGAAGAAIPRADDSNQTRMDHIHQQIDQATRSMQENIDLTIRRGDDLRDIEKQTEQLAISGAQFRKNTKKVEQNLWFKNMKMTICVVVILLVIIGIVVASFAFNK